MCRDTDEKSIKIALVIIIVLIFVAVIVLGGLVMAELFKNAILAARLLKADTFWMKAATLLRIFLLNVTCTHPNTRRTKRYSIYAITGRRPPPILPQTAPRSITLFPRRTPRAANRAGRRRRIHLREYQVVKLCDFTDLARFGFGKHKLRHGGFTERRLFFLGRRRARFSYLLIHSNL